jgi:hypothetical protein
MHALEEHLQAISLLVLAITAVIALWQLVAATKQAKSSVEQAKASVKMAKLSLEQTKLMRVQLHASFRPVVTVADGEYGLNIAMLTLRNLGAGPALAIFGVYRNGLRQSVGDLSAGQTISFRFDNYQNQILRPVGPPRSEYQSIGANQAVPLRLEYRSVTGAYCWTTVNFKLGGEGPIEPEIETGMDLPSLAANP